MTIASEIERLQDVRTDIYDELGNKCVNLDGSSKYADVAPIIKKMPVVCAKIGANKYPVVKIGNQLWTAKNLDEPLGTLGTNEWYYNNDEATYKKYGRLYTWDNVNTNLASLGLQGWRMPTTEDQNKFKVIDSTLKSFFKKGYSKGTDLFGFSLQGGGFFNGTSFVSVNNGRYFTSQEESSTWAYTFLAFDLYNIYWDGNVKKNYGCSVRLVLDLNEDGSIPDGAVIIAEADESVATLADDGVAFASVEPSTDSES